ncbi:hypothetical protein CCHL11_07163 [Colletotrichum chlorophyti]|uniref:Dockerin type 1 n=1 Tax=Colletotrichum chlorophyti TaxID=708187 RepID=A0A1Q8S0M5_9PEZI|nr:hypothetical protein CCHL11_07163 [Colletotrichum chlorophyti]
MARSSQLLLALLCQAITGTHAAPRIGAPVKAVRQAAEPATFEPQTNAGPGGSNFKDSAHFRVYNGNGNDTDAALDMLEAAYDCFVHTLGWRSSGLSYNQSSDTGPYHKTNFYTVSTLPNLSGVMKSETKSGAAYLEVVDTRLADPSITVHEYGHALHYHQRTWVYQDRTGAWWETVANWVADTYKTSPLCADARAKHNQQEGRTEFEVDKVIGDSFQVIVDGSSGTGNYYQAWPFLAYLTNNPDDVAGLGRDALHQMMVQYEENSNETPLHTLDRVATNSTAGEVVGRYWARMAYVDIGHQQAQEVFERAKDRINFANVEKSGDGYQVKAARAPRYMGANINRLTTSGGKVEVKVTSSGELTATLAIRGSDGVRYVALANGAGSATIASGEEVSLVVANTPKALILYDGFKLADSEANKGLDYSFTLSGASVA